MIKNENEKMKMYSFISECIKTSAFKLICNISIFLMNFLMCACVMQYFVLNSFQFYDNYVQRPAKELFQCILFMSASFLNIQKANNFSLYDNFCHIL